MGGSAPGLDLESAGKETARAQYRVNSERTQRAGARSLPQERLAGRIYPFANVIAPPRFWKQGVWISTACVPNLKKAGRREEPDA